MREDPNSTSPWAVQIRDQEESDRDRNRHNQKHEPVPLTHVMPIRKLHQMEVAMIITQAATGMQFHQEAWVDRCATMTSFMSVTKRPSRCGGTPASPDRMADHS